MIHAITKAYVRTYRDTGQTKVYIEWIDNKGEHGCTEGDVINTNAGPRVGAHIRALLNRAEREGISITPEVCNRQET